VKNAISKEQTRRNKSTRRSRVCFSRCHQSEGFTESSCVLRACSRLLASRAPERLQRKNAKSCSLSVSVKTARFFIYRSKICTCVPVRTFNRRVARKHPPYSADKESFSVSRGPIGQTSSAAGRSQMAPSPFRCSLFCLDMKENQIVILAGTNQSEPHLKTLFTMRRLSRSGSLWPG